MDTSRIPPPGGFLPPGELPESENLPRVPGADPELIAQCREWTEQQAPQPSFTGDLDEVRRVLGLSQAEVLAMVRRTLDVNKC